jgi:restriction endonuclease S subunit
VIKTIIKTRLGEVADFVMGQAPPSAETNTHGNGTPFVQVRNFGPLRPRLEEWTTKPLKMAAHGDVLVCIVGATVGKVNLGVDAAITRSIAAVRPNPKLLHQKYLLHWMTFNMLQLRSQSSGSAQGVISKEQLAALEIPLPNLEEQQRLVDTLEDYLFRLDKSFAQVELGRKKEKLFKRSLLHGLFESLDCEVFELGDVSKPKYGKDVPKHLRGDSFSYPVVGSAGVMTFTENALVNEPSVLVGRKGNVGAVQMFTTPCSPVDTAYYLVCPEDVDIEFMYFQLQSLDLNSLDSSTTIPSLRRQDLEAVPFRKPDISTQREISREIKEKLLSLDSALNQLQQVSESITSLRRSILNAAFSRNLLKELG